MLESGQYYGQQGFYPEWQAAGVARGNGQAPLLSRPEAIRLYEINLAAYHEAARRRERHTWFFAAANFILAAGLILILAPSKMGFGTASSETKASAEPKAVEAKPPQVAAAQHDSHGRGLDPIVILGACLALVVGLPLCRGWKRALAQSRTERALALGTIRQLENEYALRYSPLGEETKPDPKAEQAAMGREQFVPRALGWAYLLLFGYLAYAPIWDWGVRLINSTLGFNFPGPPG
jgi:hypothetical protein